MTERQLGEAAGGLRYQRGGLLRAAFPAATLTRAVIYAHPQSLHAIDMFVREYPGGHYLEWNWPNAGHGAACAYDFDGILCHDCAPEDDDDGPRYARFLSETRPLFLPRRMRIPMIVTGRSAKYRAETLAWLDRWGLSVDHLVMRDWDIDLGRNWNEQMGEYKAWHYQDARSGCPLFAESDPAQAEVINRLTGKAVLCPSAAKVHPPAA